MEKLEKLPGTQDLREGSWLALRAMQDSLRRLFSSHGYQIVDSPVLEPTELFVRKGGGEMVAQMYSFTDPGGNQVSLRPEFTSSIARMCLEGDESPLAPFRVQYSGPVFRYGGEGRPYRQFHQAGVELIGSAHPRADGEVLALACRGLAALGISEARLTLGDLGAYNGALEALGLSDRARVFVLSNVGLLKEGPQGLEAVREKARSFGLTARDGQVPVALAGIEEMEEARARELIVGLLQREESSSLGQRSPEEVAEGLLRKLRGSEDPEKVEQALDMASRLAPVRGEPREALDQGRRLLTSLGLSPDYLSSLEDVVEALSGEDMGGVSVVVDMGLARGISYYTGIVFELMDSRGQVSFGGGGRYDDLFRALGGSQDLPALGFSYTLETLLESMPESPISGEIASDEEYTLVVPQAPEAYTKALTVARDLRNGAERVEMEVCGRSLEESMTYARSRGIDTVVEVSTSGERKAHRLGPG